MRKRSFRVDAPLGHSTSISMPAEIGILIDEFLKTEWAERLKLNTRREVILLIYETLLNQIHRNLESIQESDLWINDMKHGCPVRTSDNLPNNISTNSVQTVRIPEEIVDLTNQIICELPSASKALWLTSPSSFLAISLRQLLIQSNPRYKHLYEEYLKISLEEMERTTMAGSYLRRREVPVVQVAQEKLRMSEFERNTTSYAPATLRRKKKSYQHSFKANRLSIADFPKNFSLICPECKETVQVTLKASRKNDLDILEAYCPNGHFVIRLIPSDESRSGWQLDPERYGVQQNISTVQT